MKGFRILIFIIVLMAIPCFCFSQETSKKAITPSSGDPVRLK
jgi:hypothetical protein